MYAGNMASRLVSTESSTPFAIASMRSEELLPWKNAIHKENLWVYSVEAQQSALLNTIESITDLSSQKVNLIFSNAESFVICKKENNWSGWNHIDLTDMNAVSSISSVNAKFIHF